VKTIQQISLERCQQPKIKKGKPYGFPFFCPQKYRKINFTNAILGKNICFKAPVQISNIKSPLNSQNTYNYQSIYNYQAISVSK